MSVLCAKQASFVIVQSMKPVLLPCVLQVLANLATPVHSQETPMWEPVALPTGGKRWAKISEERGMNGPAVQSCVLPTLHVAGKGDF